MLVYPSFDESPNRIHPCQGIPIACIRYRHPRHSTIPVAPYGHFPILLLFFARNKSIAFDFYEKLGNLERMPWMCVDVEISVEVEGPVKELEGIRTRDKRIGFGLERAKRDGRVEVSREVAVDIESSSFEPGHGQVNSTTRQSESDERTGRQVGEHKVIDWSTSK